MKNKNFLNLILDIAVRIRAIIEPLSWRLFSPKNWESLEDLGDFEEVKDLSPIEFSKAINRFDYKFDPISGLLDFSFPLRIRHIHTYKRHLKRSFQDGRRFCQYLCR